MSEEALQEIIHFGDYAREDELYRRFFKGGEAEICPIDSADVSLYEYYHYWNLLDACRLDHQWMEWVLNPKLGVRFKDAKRVIVNSSYWKYPSNLKNFTSTETFESFKFVHPSVYFEKEFSQETGVLRRKEIENVKKNQKIVENCVDAYSIDLDFGELIIADIVNPQLAKIHVDYPDYLFMQNDRELSYEAGRITRRIDSNWVQLITPKNELISDSCRIIRYLKENRFGILTADGWMLIDRDGKRMHPEMFLAVNEFTKDRAEFKLMDNSVVALNKEGEIVEKLPEPRIFVGQNYFYLQSNPRDLVDARSGKSDQILAEEKFLTGFFVKKEGEKTLVRRFGAPMSIEIKPTAALKSFGNCIYYSDGKQLLSIDSALSIRKHKKMKTFRLVSPEIGWLEGKNDLLIDQNWNEIHALTKNERFELRNGELVILEKDSVKLNLGSLKPSVKEVKVAEQTTELEVEVVARNGKYGAIRGNQIVLNYTYDWLSRINDEEFLTRVNTEKRVYNSQLQRVGDSSFDFFFQTASGNYVFYNDDQVSAFSFDLEKIR